MKKLFLYILILSLSGSTIRGQGSDNQTAWGGVNDIFDLPVGANAMAMGGAYVASARDPYALYWNPAALEQITNPSIALYVNNLPTGAQYNYAAIAYPTLFRGTFSAGLLRLATNDIEIRGSDDAALLGTLNYARNLFFLGYGINIFDWLAVGSSMKFEYAVFPGPEDQVTLETSSLNESSFGADVGVLLRPQFQNTFFRNTAFGLNIQNAIRRSMRLIEDREYTPRNIRAGLNRSFYFGQGQEFRFSYQVSKNEKSSIPMHHHFGFEYSYNGAILFRSGLWNGQITYGAGFKVIGVQLDYSYWNGTDEFLGNSHRISVIFNLGKTREERLADYRDAELRRIEKEVRDKLVFERREQIETAFNRAKEFYNYQDFERAATEIYKVLAHDESGDDPKFSEARRLRDKIEAAIEERREKELQLARERKLAEEERLEKQQKIKEHLRMARAYYQDEDYPAAIEESEKALAIDPNQQEIKDLKQAAEADMKDKFRKLVERGLELIEQDRDADAIDVFLEARKLARNKPELESYIRNRIERLRNTLQYEELLREATVLAQNKNWEAAAKVYQKLLEYNPNNEQLRKRYEEAHARANAKDIPMSPEAKNLWKQGTAALTDNNYEKALDFFQKALEVQPLNKVIWEGIDYVQSQIRKQRGTTE